MDCQECDSLSGTSQDGPGGLVINVRCPSLSSARWCYKLYSIVFASLGLLLTFIWVSSALPLPSFHPESLLEQQIAHCIYRATSLIAKQVQ